LNVLFLSPNFPPHYGLFCRALTERGARVLGIGEAPPFELAGDLAVADYVHVPDLTRYDDVIRAVGLLIHRYGRIDHVDSLNEHWLELEAALRRDFNIRGRGPEETQRVRQKSQMARIFEARRVPIPRGMRVHSPLELGYAAAELGLPLAFKPDVGVGASGAVELRTGADLDRLEQSDPCDGFVQEFVEGTVMSFDGLCDERGRVVFSVAFKNCAGVLQIVRDQLDVYYYTLRDIPPGLERVGRQMVEAFELRSSFFHAELFERRDGSYVALELNARPAGGFSTELMNYACDLDVYRLWADVITGVDTSDFPFDRKYHAAHVSRRDRAYAVGHDEIVRALGPALMGYRHLPPSISHVMGSPVYLVRHEDEQELLSFIELVHRRA
jgi:hypothetical protein